MSTEPDAVPVRGTESIDGGRLASAAVLRGFTLVVSGVPTVVAWALMSRRMDATDFAGVSLALSLPNVSSFILPAMGAGIANSAALGPAAFHDSVVRSVRSCIWVGLVLVTTSGVLALVGWSRILGRPQPDPFPMNAAVMAVSAAIALWLVLLIGERILIAVGEVTKRIWASALTGPVTLLGVLVVGAMDAPAWAYLIPVPVAMLAAAACSLTMAARLKAIPSRAIVREVVRGRGRSSGRSGLTMWLVVVEASLILPIWLLRPSVSVMGDNADVAALSLALQFATPVFSILAVVGQTLWPYYARNRGSLRRRDLGRHCLTMGAIAAAFGACYVVGVWLLWRWGLVGHQGGIALLVAIGVYMLVRGSWEPARIVFSTVETARALSLICCASAAVAIPLMWLFAGYGHGALAVLAVCLAFAIDVAVPIAVLSPRVSGRVVERGRPGEVRTS
jgi:hypothetical protein